MTVASTPGSEVEPWGSTPAEDWGDFGMEDVGSNELTIPRLEIVHADGVFRDRNSKAEYTQLQGIVLGVVKGRIMWAKEVEDKDQPLCRSNDFSIGFPQMRTDIPADKQFPWPRSNFDPTSITPGDDGQIRLDCGSCWFKEWDDNGFGQKKPPCAELYHLPLLYKAGDGWDTLTPAILTVKSSGVKEIRRYITPFKSSKKPMFTAYTEINLTPASRGTVRYAIPNFRRLGDADPANFAEWAELYRSTRDFLTREPRPQDPKKPIASAAAATALPDDDPWATAPVAPASPAAPWATAAPPAPAAPAAPPSYTPPPPAAAPSPPAPAPAAPPVAAPPAPVAPSAPAARPASNLPF